VNSALILLSRYKLRGVLRKAGRAFRTPRGAILSGLMLLGLVFGAGSNVVMAFVESRSPPEDVRLICPYVILGFVALQLLTSSPDKALVFSAAEVDFLFPGPFTRRQLILYNLLAGVFGAGLTALLFSTLFLRWSTWWIAGFSGMWITFLFIRLFSVTLAFSLASIGNRAYAASRIGAVALVGLLAAQGASQALASGRPQTFHDFAASFRETFGGALLFAPFEPFGRTIAAETLFPEFVLWFAVSAAIVAGMVGVVMRSNANYLESALAASEKRYEILQRLGRGRAPAIAARHTARWRVAQLPWLGGAGPVAWRQATELLRGSPRAFVVLLSMSVGIVPMLYFGRTHQSDISGPALGAIVWLSFMVTAIIPLGFRADLDYMDWLKTAPIRPIALVVGELIPAVVFVALLQGAILAGMAAFEVAPREMLLAALVFTLPVNLLLLTTENMLFLWYPTRVATSPGDLQFMGRQVVMMLTRLLFVGAAAGVAGAVLGVAWLFGARSTLALGAMAWIVLIAEGVLGVLAVARAFRRFDPSVDMPA
jgi:hypothetical protein